MKDWHLYVIAEAPDGPCKIGLAVDLRRRLSGLQIGNPRRLHIAFARKVIGCAETCERHAHRAAHAKRIGGEWFQLTVAEAVEIVRNAISAAGGSTADKDIIVARIVSQVQRNQTLAHQDLTTPGEA